MTVSNNYVPIRQLGNGVTTQFSGSWPMLNANYAQVFLENATTGVQTPVTQGAGASQYTLVFSSSGFTVTFNTAPTSANYVVIGRNVALDQTDPYRTSKGFQGQVEEDSFDKLTLIAQDTRSAITRSITVPLGDTATNLILPTAALRANGILGFDGSGNVTLVGGIPSVIISSAMQPVVTAATVAAALALMGGAPLASPALTGTPIAPTASPGTNTTQIASTAFVTAAVGAGLAIKTVKQQTFTSSGTYTPSAGMVYCIVEVLGGGGSGGSAGGGNDSAGGGAGAYSKSLLTAAAIGASKAVTIGAAGAAASNANGNAGGQSSLGTLIVCNGGAGGGADNGTRQPGGAGGTVATAGNMAATPGAPGGPSLTGFLGGWGANSQYGSGGMTQALAGVGQNASGYGAGGSGTNNNTGASGAGVPGIVIITEFCTQ